jgi:hypothetical protein
MRKVYIMRQNEEDGLLLDALIARGVEPDEGELCNPECPRCFSDTLLAYTEGNDYEVITWEELDEKDVAGADGWYLVCSNFECEWEEQVERVTAPMDAVIFNIESAGFTFDDEWGIGWGSAARQTELIEYIKELQQFRTNRKLRCFLQQAEWCLRETRERNQKWLHRVPPGRRVEISIEHEPVTGTFLAMTEEGCLFMQENGDVVTVEADTITNYWPRRFDQWGPAEDEALPSERTGATRPPDSFVRIDHTSGRVVVRGYELTFQYVDRLGQYHVDCRDPEAAQALGLEKRAENYWIGRFRRSDIQMRYDVDRMVKVRGYWFRVTGKTNSTGRTAISTEDAAAALALGLRQSKPHVWDDEGEPSLLQRTPHWSGSVPPEEVEEYTEVRSYYWPLPELHTER